ncbi:hypothetical protein GCM10011352_37240 [Marinobacterium zhoushanense]|uniref:Glycosyl transferase family 1 domain-containing protein n=1 Tax=Marinobacterium zhoushanense TaxID=1679163 RepID=A0ABQ1KS62_9GAMM|nr:glycosyltransferase family 4 protein [Marinobacterium zhoushanense]GGC07515.1 hypothetical protein GCM10011352_37240 [Marinobacterium zhoushanense]
MNVKTKPSRLLYVVPDFFPSASGYAHACENFIYAVANLGYEVLILSFKPAELPTPHDNIAIKSILRSNRDEMKTIFKEQLGSNWDALIIETFENSDVCNWLIDTLNIPLVSTAVRIHAATETEIYASTPNEYYSRMFDEAKCLASKVPNIWSTTNYYIDFFKDQYGLTQVEGYLKRYSIIPNIPGKRKKELLPEPSAHLIDILSKNNKNKTLFALGRMSEQGVSQKNFRTLLDAIAIAQDELKKLGSKVLIIGDGELRRSLEIQARSINISDLVSFVSELSHEDILHLTRISHAGILISTYEGHSMFSVECLSNGLPLLFSEKTGIAEYIEHGKTGVSVDPNDPFSVAEGLIEITRGEHNKDSIKSQYLQKFGQEITISKCKFIIDQLASRSKYPKAIVFGTGGYLNKVIEKINRNFNIVAFADNSIEKQGNSLFGAPIIAPSHIHSIDHDLVILASSATESIKAQLIELKIQKENIIKLDM